MPLQYHIGDKMRKDDNTWKFDILEGAWNLELNNTCYIIDSNTAAICHSILLLVDAVNDKGVK